MNNYPKALRIIMREAPLAHSILAVSDYRNGTCGAIELLRQWNHIKKIKKIVI